MSKLIEDGAARLRKAREADPASVSADGDAATPAPTPPAVPTPTAPAAGPLPAEYWPVHLARDEPREPLNVRIPWSLRRALNLLTIRDGTDIQDEVAEALTAHFARKNLVPPSFWDRG